MHAELPVLSFLCVALLLALLPLHRKSVNVAVIALIIWLLACNITQGMNSILWRNDSIVRAVVWCDIVTKIHLGAQLALPASCVCIVWHFYHISSSSDGKRRGYRRILESLLCIICPLIYMALHIIVQDNRFELTRDFGCTSSTHTTLPALILVWIPPLILCSIIYVFAFLALWSHFRVERSRISRSTITLTFIRPLLTSIVIASLILFATVFTIYARIAASHGLLPWTSLADTHSTISKVVVIPRSSRMDVARIAVAWWSIPSISLVFFAQTIFGLLYGPRGEDSTTGLRTIGHWVNRKVLRKSVGMESFITSSPSITLKSPPTPTPVHLLKSGWDDTLRSNNSQAKAKTRPRPPPIICDIVPPSPTTSSSETDCDNPFGASMFSYLPSPPETQTLEPPPRAQMKSVTSSPFADPAQSSHRPSVPAVQGQTSKSPASVASSILSRPWPEPPSSIPLSSYSPSTVSIPSPASTYSQTSSHAIRHVSKSSVSGSMASSTVSMHGYAVYDPALPPPTPHRAPFDDAVSELALSAPSRKQKGLRKMGSKDNFTGKRLAHGLSRKVRDRPSTRDGNDSEAIYMTVVQETV